MDVVPTQLALHLKHAHVTMVLITATAGTCERMHPSYYLFLTFSDSSLAVCTGGCGSNSACTAPETCTCNNGFDESATAGTCERMHMSFIYLNTITNL